MHKLAMKGLESLQMEIWAEVNSTLLPPDFYLSDSDIKHLLDNF
jgi:hypothetical protein